MRRWISVVSFGWFETMATPRSFSNQRKAGMSSLVPCSSPAWLAPVWLDQSHSHGIRRWLPSSSQRVRLGACPLRIARWSTSWARPSISRKSTPGTSVGATPSLRAAFRTTFFQ